jgi:hypothetical protein
MSHLSDEVARKHLQAWSEQDKAFNTKLLSNQFAVELNKNEDSITCFPASTSMEQGIQSCIGMKTVCLFGEGTVFVSPSDEGDEWFQLTMVQLVPTSICARRIKLEGNAKLVLQTV